MTAAPAERFPIDMDALKKGSYIEPDIIERAYGTKREMADHQLSCLKLAKEIERYLRDRGFVWTLKQERGGLRILEDAEASEYNAQLGDKNLRSIVRVHNRQSHVDVGALSDEEARHHEHRLLRSSFYVQAIADTRRKLAAEERRRRLKPPTQDDDGANGDQ